MSEQWAQFVELARKISAEMFGSEPIEILFVLEDKRESRLPLPSRIPIRSADSPWHSKDFRQISWPGLGVFYLTLKQAAVIRLLWKARAEGAGDLPGQVLLRAADSDSNRLVDLFAKSSAWRTLIQSTRKGLYHLPYPIENN